MNSVFNIFPDNEERKMLSALETYFKKIDTPLYYANNPYLARQFKNRKAKYLTNILKEKYIFKRDKKLDFDYFKAEHGFGLPNSLKAYASFCHPCIIGFHASNPYRQDAILLWDTFDEKPVFNKCFENGKYIIIGIVDYFDAYIVMESNTGKIFVENDEKDYVFNTLLADSMTDFIKAIEPYWPEEDELRHFGIGATLQKQRKEQ